MSLAGTTFVTALKLIALFICFGKASSPKKALQFQLSRRPKIEFSYWKYQNRHGCDFRPKTPMNKSRQCPLWVKSQGIQMVQSWLTADIGNARPRGTPWIVRQSPTRAGSMKRPAAGGSRALPSGSSWPASRAAR